MSHIRVPTSWSVLNWTTWIGSGFLDTLKVQHVGSNQVSGGKGDRSECCQEDSYDGQDLEKLEPNLRSWFDETKLSADAVILVRCVGPCQGW